MKILTLLILASLVGCTRSEPELVTNPDDLSAYLEDHPSREMPEPSMKDFPSP